MCETLLEKHAEVTCLDSFSTGLRQNVEHLTGRKGFRVITGNVEDFKSDEKFNYILHMASRASPEEYQQHPVETVKVNSIGTLNMLELARQHRAIFLYASSSEVYGQAAVVPTPETYWGNVNPIGVRSSYDETKRFGEAACMAYMRKYGVDVRIARIFNTYGGRLRPDGLYGRALARFMMQALQNREITVYGDGKQTRSFCYVSDMCEALVSMLTKKEAANKPMNVGNPVETTILELANLILEITKSQSKITFTKRAEDDPERRCPDITLAKRVLEWEPKISLREGLQKTMPWVSNFLEISGPESK